MNATQNQPSKFALGQYAGFVSRLVAFMVDLLIITIIVLVFSWFLSIIKVFNTRNAIINIGAYLPFISNLWNLIYNPVTFSIASILIIMGYFVLFFLLGGQTPGKALMGVKIVPLKGGKVKFWQAIVRYLGYYVSFIVFGLGFLWIIGDARRMAWHDKMARTCVIYSWNAKPDETFLAGAMDEVQARREAVRAFISRRQLGKFSVDMPEIAIPEAVADQPVEQPDSSLKETTK